MDTIKVLKKSIRDYKLPSILTPIFIIGEVVLETLIPTVMAVLIDEISKSISMDPIIKYGLILLAMALASLLCGFIAASLRRRHRADMQGICATICIIRFRTSRLRKSTGFRRRALLQDLRPTLRTSRTHIR